MGKSSQELRGRFRQDETREQDEEIQQDDRRRKKKKKKSKKSRKSAKRDTESKSARGDNGDVTTEHGKSGPLQEEERTTTTNSETKSEETLSHPSVSQPLPQNPPPPGSHPFEVDDSDHCETPLRAYQDLAVLLDRLVAHKNETNSSYSRSSLRIYDPYYCDGGVKTKLASLGFTQVINENRDFYEDIQNQAIPDYDVLVTNPPYSGHHMERLLDFCVAQSQAKHHQPARPSFLLLPHFVYTKDYYARALAPLRCPHQFVSFLVPSVRYSYVPPSWVVGKSGASKALSRGKETTAPFPSFWYCCQLDLDGNSNSNNSNITHEWLEATFGPSGSVVSRDSQSRLRYARTPGAIPREFKGEFDPTKKRPNPKARKRLRKAAAKAAAAAGGAGQAPPPQQQQQPKKRQRQRERDPKRKKKRRY